jgi:hypothetical protein
MALDKAIAELRRSMLTFKLFNLGLTSLVVFMAALLFTSFFGLRWHYALIPALLWAAVTGMHITRMDYSEVERKTPMLQDALRTAADTVKDMTRLAKELHEEVLGKMHAVHTSQFLGFGKTTYLLLAVAVLAYLIIGLSAFGVDAKATKDFVTKTSAWTTMMSAWNETFKNETILLGSKKEGLKRMPLRSNASLYGDERDIELGNTPLELQVDPVLSGANLKDAQEA